MESEKQFATLGAFLRDWRLNKLKTQQEAAKSIGVSRCWYNLLECDRRNPSLVVVGRIAKATKKSPSFIWDLINK